MGGGIVTPGEVGILMLIVGLVLGVLVSRRK